MINPNQPGHHQDRFRKERIIKHDPSKEYYFQEGCHIIETLNTPDDPDLSIARARVEPGVTTKIVFLRFF